MQDLTEGPIPGHLARMAIPIAGLASAGTLQFLIMALTQILGVGTMALIAHASGRKDRADANLIFNQSLGLALVCAVVTLVGGYALAHRYMGTLGADAATVAAGTTYLYWFLPGLGLQFALISMGSALRGTGIVKPTIVVQILTVLLNAILSPIMIAGWFTGRPMGVAGAGLSTTTSSASITSWPSTQPRCHPAPQRGSASSRSDCPQAASSPSCSCTWGRSTGPSVTSGPRPRRASAWAPG